MEKFIKRFGFTPAKKSDKHVEYRGFSDIDKQAVVATRLMNELGLQFISLEKSPQLKGFTIYF